MDESKKQIVAADSLVKAKSYIKKADWARAFAHFLVVFELFPNEKYNYEREFENILSQLRLWLENHNQTENIFNCYVQAIRHFPTNITMLNDFGSHWVRLDQPEIALQYLEAAHELDEKFLLAEKNLQSAKLNIIPRWHFRMLNDRKRNQAYCDAIFRAITSQHNRVLDIGAGCGLLSFYASQCKDVQRIISVESSNTLAGIAKKCLNNANLITVINSNSTILDSNNIGLSNILITEIFDTALFGERALETLIHAWDNLLVPHSKIVPCGADLYITGISSNNILSKHKVIDNSLEKLNMKDMCVMQCDNEPYEAEILNKDNVKYVTNTEKVLHIDFNNVQHLKEIYSLETGISPFTLKCVENETIHAFAIWFDLHLDDAITLTTNPFKDNVCCWEQAVIYLDHPLMLAKGQEIVLKVSCSCSMLKIKVVDRPKDCLNCFKISSDMITFFNDTHVMKAAETLNLPHRFNSKHCVILDLSPVPLFALFRAKKNFSGHYICVGNNDNDCSFLNMLWTRNINDKMKDVTYEIVLRESIFDKILNDSIDVIFINPISENGILSEETFNDLPALSAALKKDGILLPQSLCLKMEVMDSKHLDFCSKVIEENLLGFRVADELNKYSILEQWQVKQECYARETLCPLSTDFNILNNHPLFTAVNAVMLKDGIANGILYGYKLEYSNDAFIDTYQSSYYNNACFIFKHPQVVKRGDTLVIKIIKDGGLLKVICKDWV